MLLPISLFIYLSENLIAVVIWAIASVWKGLKIVMEADSTILIAYNILIHVYKI